MVRIIVSAVVLMLVVYGCNGQVQVPQAQTTGSTDSLRARTGALESISVALGTRTTNLEVLAKALSDRTNDLESKTIMVDTCTVVFPDTAWRVTKSVQGIDGTWKLFYSARYTSDAVQFDAVQVRDIGINSFTLIRKSNGTPNLAVDVILVKP